MVLIRDASHFCGEADQILFPESEEEVASILREAHRTKTPVTVSGAGTGLTGARVPKGGILLSTERMNRILRIERDPSSINGRAVLQPGVPLKELEEALKPQGLFYPPNPGEKKAFIGGTVATNASGSRSFKYGPTRRYVRRLRIALAGGELLDLPRGNWLAQGGALSVPLPDGTARKIPVPTYSMPAVKNAAGYFAAPNMDLIDLFIGSEGTLGIFTEVELDLLPVPESILSGILFFADEWETFRFASEARRLGPRALEFFDSRSLRLLSEKHPKIPKESNGAIYFEHECAAQERDAVKNRWIRLLDRFPGFVPDPWISFEPKDRRFYREFRYDLPVLVNEQLAKNGFQKSGTDMAVPGPKAEEMFRFYLQLLREGGINFVIFGHIGDNHLHVDLLPESQEQFARSQVLYDRMAEKAIMLGGTISAEHGIGKVRIPYLERMVGKEGLRQMAQVKQALDPNGILSPGNIIPVELLRG